VIDRVRADLNETTAGFWTDAQLIKWTDEAVKDIIYKTRCTETGVSTTTLQNAVRTYSLSSVTFLDVEKVEHDSGVTTDPQQVFDLDRAMFRNLRYGREKETGRPKVFSVWNNALYIWPIPANTSSDTYSGTTLYIYYIPRPSGVTTTTSVIETPAYFDVAVYDYVKAKALAKDGQASADYFMKSYTQRLMDYVVNVLRRNIFEYPSQQTQP
jgi:hypothetical protein